MIVAGDVAVPNTSSCKRTNKTKKCKCSSCKAKSKTIRKGFREIYKEEIMNESGVARILDRANSLSKKSPIVGRQPVEFDRKPLDVVTKKLQPKRILDDYEVEPTTVTKLEKRPQFSDLLPQIPKEKLGVYDFVWPSNMALEAKYRFIFKYRGKAILSTAHGMERMISRNELDEETTIRVLKKIINKAYEYLENGKIKEEQEVMYFVRSDKQAIIGVIDGRNNDVLRMTTFLPNKEDPYAKSGTERLVIEKLLSVYRTVDKVVFID